ncbi:MAG TPA: PocR ligand-binding domain-containing protein [Clostridia bacterium]|nr:PocR ligand-binding domain-containing protein [Clostridia bacterium]HPQ46494.1 PocR ligand-binding domain-containing protein [Clostridia bacterium]HRX41412.1 PocR ligand-binding domain-containing protein [Clostridia bacterium]
MESMENIREIARIYSESTGIDTRLVDSSGKTISLTCSTEACRLCDVANKKTGGKCEKTHLYGSIQADRFGGKYVFFCHLGLVHWVTPVYKDDQLEGGIVAGPVLMVDPVDLLPTDLELMEGIIENPLDVIEKIPVVTPSRVDSLSQLLYYSAFSNRFSVVSEALDTHADIAQYIQYLKTMGGEGADHYPLDKENKLITMITLGDKTGAQKVLNEILAHTFLSTGRDFSLVKARILELVVVLSRAALHGGADNNRIFGMNYKYLNQINEFRTIEELTIWISEIIKTFTECVFDLQDVKHIDVIYKSIEYIRRNYMKKVTLDDVAENVSLSPSYFSRIFKQETKTSFNSYLNNVRIEMSKKLLLDEDIPLVDIAVLAGFENQSYYSRVFKQITGLSPRQFREKRLRR